jgi:hypothetical protein
VPCRTRCSASRLHGMQEVAGSSPASSIRRTPAHVGVFRLWSEFQARGITSASLDRRLGSGCRGQLPAPRTFTARATTRITTT